MRNSWPVTSARQLLHANYTMVCEVCVCAETARSGHHGCSCKGVDMGRQPQYVILQSCIAYVLTCSRGKCLRA